MQITPSFLVPPLLLFGRPGFQHSTITAFEMMRSVVIWDVVVDFSIVEMDFIDLYPMPSLEIVPDSVMVQLRLLGSFSHVRLTPC